MFRALRSNRIAILVALALGLPATWALAEFVDVPLRTNANPRILPEWFNTLRSEGIEAQDILGMDETTIPAGGTTSFTILPTDTFHYIHVNTTVARTVQLPSPAAVFAEFSGARTYLVKDASGQSATNPITLARAASEKIDNVASNLSLAVNYGAWRVWTDGTDWFTHSAFTGSSSGDHGALTGLGDDDHTIYLLLSGRSGGQVITGGTASGDDLTLRSTTNGTKGNVILDETTASTSTATGALVVSGGVGIAENLNVGGTASSPGAGANSEHFGASSTAAGTGGTAFGNAAVAATTDSTTIGRSITATQVEQTLIGARAASNGLRSSAFGADATANGDDTTAVGNGSLATGPNTIAFGAVSSGVGAQGTALGKGSAIVSAVDATIIGYNSSATNHRVVAVGSGASAGGDSAIAIGLLAASSGLGAQCYGRACSNSTANSAAWGSSTLPVTDYWFGEGPSTASPSATTLMGSAASGTNVAGGNVTLGAGQSTGTGTGGTLNLATSLAGGSGSSVNALTTWLSITSAGIIDLAGAAKNSNTTYTEGNMVPYVATALYDFAADGGAAGTINMGVQVPDNAIAYEGGIDVLTSLTSGTSVATVSLNLEGAGDLRVATIVGSWAAGFYDVIPADAAASYIKTTAARQLSITVANEDLTGGKFIAWVRYYLSQ